MGHTCKVYHICREEELGDYLKGYIGVSINPLKRFEHHRNRSQNPHLKSALEKYKDIALSILFTGSEEECYSLEYHLRPCKNLGWNIAIGGGKPPSPKGTERCIGRLPKELRRKQYTHSEATIKKLTKINQSNAGILAESRLGAKNPMFGMTGKQNPNFKGTYITPYGVFESTIGASQVIGVSRQTITNRCCNSDTKIVSYKVPKEWLGKTWKDLGWDFKTKEV